MEVLYILLGYGVSFSFSFCCTNKCNKILGVKVMWEAVKRALGPKVSRKKCEMEMVGTPLTHERFLRRNHGTYGPAIRAGK